MMWVSGVLTVVMTGVLTLFAQQQIVQPGARPPSLRLLAPDPVVDSSVAAALTASAGRSGSEKPGESGAPAEAGGLPAESGGTPSGPESPDDVAAGDTRPESRARVPRVIVDRKSHPGHYEIRLMFDDEPLRGLRVLDIRLISSSATTTSGERDRWAAANDLIVRVGIESDEFPARARAAGK